MRKILLLALIVLLLILILPAAAQTSQFEGTWVNADPATNGLFRLEISGTGSVVRVHAWARCDPTDCDWGEVTGYAYGPDDSSNVPDSAQVISALYDLDSSQRILLIRPVGDGTLQVELLTRFTDDSGNSSYTLVAIFAREQADHGAANADMPQPVLHLPFDGNVIDYSANGLSTQTTGDITFEPGVIGQAAHFDGSGAAVVVPDIETLPITNALTLAFWVKMDEWKNPYSGSAHIESIASRSVFYTVAVSFDSWNLEARLTIDDTAEESVDLRGGRVPPGEWHHIALVYRGDVGHLLLFLDGSIVDSTTVSGRIIAPDGVDFVVGTWFQQNQAFAGMVDDLRLYDVGLSNEQIWALAGH